MSEVAVVLPTCRRYMIPAQTVTADWIVVHDRELRPIEVEHGEEPQRTNGNVLRNLVDGVVAANLVAPDVARYGEGTSAIRQAGLDYAYDAGYKYVLTVDDDCLLPRDWVQAHLQCLRGSVSLGNNTVPGEVIRGNPRGGLPVGISHGLWSGVLDYPAWYQLSAHPELKSLEDRGFSRISAPFPMCGMNVGFRRECLPAVYFQHQFLRHDDIFAGWLAEKVLTLHGYGFANGGAVVQHLRASNAEANLVKELPGDAINDWLVRKIFYEYPYGKSLGDPLTTLNDLVRWLYTQPIPTSVGSDVAQKFDAWFTDIQAWIQFRRESQ